GRGGGMSAHVGRVRPPMTAGRLLAAARRSLPIVVTAIVILSGWQLTVRLLEVPSFILPAPSMIASALGAELSTILSASRITVQAVLAGLVIGAAAGVLVALVISRFRRISAPVLSVAVIINCAPIVALAPIFNNWFGVTSLVSKVGVAAV